MPVRGAPAGGVTSSAATRTTARLSRDPGGHLQSGHPDDETPNRGRAGDRPTAALIGGYATACSFLTIAGSISTPSPGVSGSVTTPRSTFMPPEQGSTVISW